MGDATDDTAELSAVPAAPDTSGVVTVPPIASHRAPRRRRRWPWVALAAVVVALALVAGAGLWHISGLIGAGARIAQPDPGFPLIVTAAEATSVTYSGPVAEDADRGLMGLATVEGGYAQTDRPSSAGGQTTRAVTAQALPPVPAAGEDAVLDGWYFPRNPLVGLGLSFEEVRYDAPLGATPAWLIPGPATTWVVFTHGRGASPAEGLRMAETVSGLGYPMLLIRYRNDARAPQADGLGRFGATEWRDLEAAVQYALDNGAQKVVLAGASMGGAITLSFLQNSALADRVVGAFLDSPVTDFAAVVEGEAADMGLPPLVTSAAMSVAAWRYGFDWAATDYTAAAAGFTTPMVIVQGTADATVPAAVTQAFAAAADPAVVTLELFEGAGHVLAWNVDRPRYADLLTAFLGRVAPVA